MNELTTGITIDCEHWEVVETVGQIFEEVKVDGSVYTTILLDGWFYPFHGRLSKEELLEAIPNIKAFFDISPEEYVEAFKSGMFATHKRVGSFGLNNKTGEVILNV